MSARNAEERQIRMTLTCGKCGSKAIVSDNDNSYAVPALKCLICGNRQEEGTPCRWPFFQEGIGSSAMQKETDNKVVGEKLKHGVDLVMAAEPRKREAPKKNRFENCRTGAFGLVLGDPKEDPGEEVRSSGFARLVGPARSPFPHNLTGKW